MDEQIVVPHVREIYELRDFTNLALDWCTEGRIEHYVIWDVIPDEEIVEYKVPKPVKFKVV